MDAKSIKELANESFKKKDWITAFNFLLQLDSKDFISYSQKTGGRNKKQNWLIGESGKVFWKEFATKEHVFDKIFSAEYVLDLLFIYFTDIKYSNPELDQKLAEQYPEVFIKAVRVSQVFLKDHNRLKQLLNVNFNNDFATHKEVWTFLSEKEVARWLKVENELKSLRPSKLETILAKTIIWIEEVRFKNPDRVVLQRLAKAYSLLIELLLTKYPEKFKKLDYSSLESKIIENVKRSSQSGFVLEFAILDEIAEWIFESENAIQEYCFNESVKVEKGSDGVYIKVSPEEQYQFLKDGVRYFVNENYYVQQGAAISLGLQEKGELKIPHGRHQGDFEKNQFLSFYNFATKNCLLDINATTLRIENEEVDSELLVHMLQGYSFNRQVKYESSLNAHKAKSTSWSQAFFSLSRLESIKEDILKEPFILHSKKEFFDLNRSAIPGLKPHLKENLIQTFALNTNSKKKKQFKRFNVSYDVWKTPFLLIEEQIFTPIAFFSNNIWFYNFVGKALDQKRLKQKQETGEMESSLGKLFEEKGWEVKVISDHESNSLNGDVDVFVDDGSTTLLLQLKRTGFKLDQKGAFYDSYLTDRKATQQLKDAIEDEELKNIFQVRSKNKKWIVSTSFEHIGKEINDCKKVSFFELIRTLEKPEISSIDQLEDYLLGDEEMKRMLRLIIAEEWNKSNTLFYDEIIQSLQINDQHIYQRPIWVYDQKSFNYGAEIWRQAYELEQKNDLNNASQVWKEYIKLCPKDGQGFGALANVLADQRNFDESYVYFNNALKLLPDEPFILRNYYLALIEGGNWKEGLQLALETKKKYPLLIPIAFEVDLKIDECIKNGYLDPNDLRELLR